MTTASPRKLAAAGAVVTGVAAAAGAFVVVGGLPGALYAAGIALAAIVGAVAIVAGAAQRTPTETGSAPRKPLWRRKSHIIAELELGLAATGAELEEHREALAKLATQLTRESEAAELHTQQLEQRIRELEHERDGLQELLADERDRFEQTLDTLGGGLGRHGSELAELERELEALIAR